MSIVFFRMSRFGLASARSTSITMSCITCARGSGGETKLSEVLQVGPGHAERRAAAKTTTRLAVVELQLVQAVEDDQLDVIVALGGEQLRVAVGRGPNGGRCRGHRHQAAGTLIHDGGVVGAQEADDDFDVLPLLGRRGAADLREAI